ncbi:MAG: ATP-binding protein [Patescibacteria group bacterium]|nr:ATP-binding protein [Patescibacteria group bacterium]
MSERIDRGEQQQPPFSVKWNGSEVTVHDHEAIMMVDGPGNGEYYKLYDRADFRTPIERAKVLACEVRNEDDEAGTEYGAKIILDRSRNDLAQLRKNFITGFATPSHNRTDKSLTIDGSVFSNVFRVSHADGATCLVHISEKGYIEISNNVIYSGGENSESRVQVVAKPRDISNPEAELTGFLQTFMRSMDIASGLDAPSHRLTDGQLSRQYELTIGENIIQPTNNSITKKIGKIATNNSQKSEQSERGPADLPEINPTDAKLSLEDIGGLHDVKAALKDIAMSFKHPEIMEKWGAKRPQGVLLYGEPGTGKTMLTEALANEIGSDFWAIQSSDIYQKWLGESEQAIKEIFARARQHKDKPLILFFDEFESIVGIDEGEGSSRAMNAVAGIFKQEMNTLAEENPQVLVVAATNDYDSIDPSLTRSGRFDHKVYVPMPDEGARTEIIASVMTRAMRAHESDDFKIFGDDVDVPEISKATDGMSGADINEIFRRLSLEKAMTEARTGQPQNPVTQALVDAAINHFRTNG